MANPFPFSSGAVLTAANLNAIGEWTSFTPSWTNFTPGVNATENWWYAVINGVLHVTGRTVLGTTSSVTGAIRMDVPTGTMFSAQRQAVGVLQMREAGASANYVGVWEQYDTTKVQADYFEVSGSLIESTPTNTNDPFAWGNNDQIRGSFTVHLQ